MARVVQIEDRRLRLDGGEDAIDERRNICWKRWLSVRWVHFVRPVVLSAEGDPAQLLVEHRGQVEEFVGRGIVREEGRGLVLWIEERAVV